MNDRELLELAAKAAGLEIHKQIQAKRDSSIDPEAAGLFIANGSTWWNPLTDDGDALRLAVKLGFLEGFGSPSYDHVTEWTPGMGPEVVPWPKFSLIAFYRLRKHAPIDFGPV